MRLLWAMSSRMILSGTNFEVFFKLSENRVSLGW